MSNILRENLIAILVDENTAIENISIHSLNPSFHILYNNHTCRGKGRAFDSNTKFDLEKILKRIKSLYKSKSRYSELTEDQQTAVLLII